MQKLSKTQKVFNALSEAGDKGVHSWSLIQHGGLRYAARVYDLKQEGHDIYSLPETKNNVRGARYFLRSDDKVTAGRPISEYNE